VLGTCFLVLVMSLESTTSSGAVHLGFTEVGVSFASDFLAHINDLSVQKLLGFSFLTFSPRQIVFVVFVLLLGVNFVVRLPFQVCLSSTCRSFVELEVFGGGFKVFCSGSSVCSLFLGCPGSFVVKSRGLFEVVGRFFQ